MTSVGAAEWWCQCIGAADEIGLHWDRDYDMQADQGLQLPPPLATVPNRSSSAAPPSDYIIFYSHFFIRFILYSHLMRCDAMR